MVVSGRCEFEPQPDAIGHILTGLLGSPLTSLVSSGVWQHVFEGRADRPSYTVEGAIRGLAGRTAGVKFSSLSINAAPGMIPGAIGDFLGRELVPGTTAVASYYAEEAAPWYSSTVQVSGAGEPMAVGVSVSIVAPLVSFLAYGSSGKIAGLLPAGGLGPGVSLVIHEQTSAWLSYALLGTPLSVSVLLAGSTIGATSYQLTIECPYVLSGGSMLAVAPRTIPGAAISLPVFSSPSALRGVKVTLVNVVSGY